MRRSRDSYNNDDLEKLTVNSVDSDICEPYTDTLEMKSMNYAEKQRSLSSVDMKRCA